MNDETYIDKLAKIPGIRHQRFLHGTWLPERGLADVSTKDIYNVAVRTHMAYGEVMKLSYDEFQELKSQERR